MGTSIIGSRLNFVYRRWLARLQICQIEQPWCVEYESDLKVLTIVCFFAFSVELVGVLRKYDNGEALITRFVMVQLRG